MAYYNTLFASLPLIYYNYINKLNIFLGGINILKDRLAEIDRKIAEVSKTHELKAEQLKQKKDAIIAKEKQKEKQIRALMLVDKGALLEIPGLLEVPNSVLLGMGNEFKSVLLDPDSAKYKEWDITGNAILQKYKYKKKYEE